MSWIHPNFLNTHDIPQLFLEMSGQDMLMNRGGCDGGRFFQLFFDWWGCSSDTHHNFDLFFMPVLEFRVKHQPFFGLCFVLSVCGSPVCKLNTTNLKCILNTRNIPATSKNLKLYQGMKHKYFSVKSPAGLGLFYKRIVMPFCYDIESLTWAS